MTRLAARLLPAIAGFWLLAACVPDQSLIDAGLAKPPEPKVQSDAYVTRQDGSFTLPAIPLEKLPVEYQRQKVYFPTEEVPGTIIINPKEKHLYFVTGKNEATRYGIAVGREGFEWSGEAIIAKRQPWPMWTPPPEMIERKPELAKWEKGQPGGPENPLGARALYLTTDGRDYGFRIHGTPEWQSIGHNASSGCIRLINQDIIDLYNRAPDGAKVIVLTRDGQMPKGLSLPPPAPKKAAKVEATDVPEPLVPLNPAPPPVFTLPPPVEVIGPI